MTHTDAMVLNDSEGLFRSTKRHDMTGARTYVLLSPNTNIAELEQQFAKRNYSYTMYNQSYAVVANYISDRAQKKGAFVLGWVTGIVGTLILLVGLINFFHFLIGSFLNRTKEYSIMKMAGCNWKQQFCLLFVQSLIVVVISSFLVIWGIESIGNRMDFSLQGITMTFPPEILLIHAM